MTRFICMESMWVHPRVGGETVAVSVSEAVSGGPSPRGRGNLRVHQQLLPLKGSIPAWAGKPLRRRCRSRHPEVHPRVGGETARSASNNSPYAGPSPRGRGNPRYSPPISWVTRSIPAWAGKPGRSRCSVLAAWVHPRVGGETHSGHLREVALAGPSPRGRGNPQSTVRWPPASRSIPAWAGKPGVGRAAGAGFVVHPRVGGETASITRCCASVTGPSPRGRGNHSGASFADRFIRSIPAWAGKPPQHGPVRQRFKVHPRVGGETGAPTPPTWSGGGPSPRGRGNPLQARNAHT